MSAPDISTLLNPQYLAWAKRAPRILCRVVIVVCLVSLVGFALGIHAFRAPIPGWVAMKPRSALGLILISVALLSRYGMAASSVRDWITRGASLGAGVLGARAFHWTGSAAEMSFLTALNLILLSAALWSSTVPLRLKHPLSHALAFCVGICSVLPLIAFVYGSQFAIGAAVYSEMAPDAALCFLGLSVAIFLSDIDHDLVAVLISDGPGGAIARRLLPVAILLPVLLGWVRVAGERQGVLSVSFGTALFATVTMASLLAFIWGQSVAIQRAEVSMRASVQEKDKLRIEGEVREQLISFFSHDLRTPLTAASARAQLIRRHPERADLAERYSADIVASIERVDEMIQALLDVKRLQAGEIMSLSIGETDLRAVLDSTVAELSAIHGDRFVIRGRGRLVGYWDSGAVRRAVQNLCSNAVKYGATGEPILIGVRSIRGHALISVHNEGEVIPEDEREHLFEPFHRAKEVTGTGRPGWGIGLALVRAVAMAHGGAVRVASSPVRGTTFTVDLPLDARNPAALHLAQSPSTMD